MRSMLLRAVSAILITTAIGVVLAVGILAFWWVFLPGQDFHFSTKISFWFWAFVVLAVLAEFEVREVRSGASTRGAGDPDLSEPPLRDG